MQAYRTATPIIEFIQQLNGMSNSVKKKGPRKMSMLYALTEKEKN